MPEVKPLRLGHQLQVRQPKHAPFFQLPRNEAMVTVSGGGKTVAHIRTLMDPDKLGGIFDKYLVMSPNCLTDPNFIPLAKYIERTTGQKKEDCFHEEWDNKIIEETMAEMRKVNAYIRKNKEKLGATHLYSCHITIDDWADNPQISHSPSSPLIKLFTKGRHSQCSTTILTQKWRLLNSAIRVNCHSLWIGRIVSSLERRALTEEFGEAAGNDQAFAEMLKRATAPEYGFLFVVFGLKVRFFSSYRSEFRVADAAE
jgi:hypothetical protein